MYTYEAIRIPTQHPYTYWSNQRGKVPHLRFYSIHNIVWCYVNTFLVRDLTVLFLIQDY